MKLRVDKNARTLPDAGYGIYKDLLCLNSLIDVKTQKYKMEFVLIPQPVQDNVERPLIFHLIRNVGAALRLNKV